MQLIVKQIRVKDTLALSCLATARIQKPQRPPSVFIPHAFKLVDLRVEAVARGFRGIAFQRDRTADPKFGGHPPAPSIGQR